MSTANPNAIGSVVPIWTGGGVPPGAIAIGDPVGGSAPNELLFVDGAGNLAQSPDLYYDGTFFVFAAADSFYLTTDTAGGPVNYVGHHTGGQIQNDFNGTVSAEKTIQCAFFSATPAGGDLTKGFKLGGNAAAVFGIYFGSGAPAIAAAKGSLYLRIDGTGVNDRMYIATDSAGTWTAVVTVA